jgi:hypothetical protein
MGKVMRNLLKKETISEAIEIIKMKKSGGFTEKKYLDNKNSD